MNGYILLDQLVRNEFHESKFNIYILRVSSTKIMHYLSDFSKHGGGRV